MILITGREARGAAHRVCRINTFAAQHVLGSFRDDTCSISASVPEQERGAALVIALIVMTTLAMLTIGSLEMLMLNVQIASNHIYDLQALYIADAGVEDAIDRLRGNPSWSAGLSDEEFPVGSGNTYSVIIDNSGFPSIVITSTGTVSDFQRSLEVQVEITGSSSPYSVQTAYWKEL